MDQYVRGRPHPALTGLAVGYSGYRESSAGPVRRRQAPTGACAMILGLGPPLRLHGPAGPLVPTSFLAGLHESAVVTEFVGEQLGMQVNLTPGARRLHAQRVRRRMGVVPIRSSVGPARVPTVIT